MSSNLTLEDNVTLKSTMIIDGTVVIDLAGKKIDSATSGFKCTNNALIAVKRDLITNTPDLTVNDSVGNGEITGPSIWTDASGKINGAIRVYGNGTTDSAKLTVNGGTISAYWYGISGNGTMKETENYSGTNITINDGTIKCLASHTAQELANPTNAALGIYHPQIGKITINGGTIEGETGIEIRAGELNVTGGTIKTTTATTTYAASPNGSGSTTAGAGIAISQHLTKKDISLNVTGGNISGVVALSITNPQSNGTGEGELTVDIKGGTFTGSQGGSPIATGSADDRVNVNISDGTFNGKLQTATINGTDEKYKLESSSFNDTYKKGAYNITGGEFASDVSAYVTDKSTCQVLDGKTYVGDSISKMTATAYSYYVDDVLNYSSTAPTITGGKIKGADNKETTVVAQIGENRYYTTFAKALDSDSSTGATIKLIGALSENFTAATEITKEVTIDLNGQTFTQSQGITVKSGGNLTVIDTGTDTTKEGILAAKVRVESGGAANVKSGKVTDTVTNNGTFTMTGGSIETSANTNAIENNGTLNFSGGKIRAGGTGINNKGTNNISGGSIFGKTGIKMLLGALSILGGKIRGYASGVPQNANVPEVISPETGTDVTGTTSDGVAIFIAPEKTSDSDAKLTVNIGDPNNKADIEIAGTAAALNVGSATNGTGTDATKAPEVTVGLYDGKLSAIAETEGGDATGSAISYNNSEVQLNIDGVILENKFDIGTGINDVVSTSDSNKKIYIKSMAVAGSSSDTSTAVGSSSDAIKSLFNNVSASTLDGASYSGLGDAISKNSVAEISNNGATSSYSSLNKAIEKAGTNDSITLSKDLNISEAVNVTQNVTLNLGNNKLTYAGSDNAGLIVKKSDSATSDAELTLTIDNAEGIVNSEGKVLGIAMGSGTNVKIKKGASEATDFKKSAWVMTGSNDATPAYFQDFQDAMDQLDEGEMVIASISEDTTGDVPADEVVEPADVAGGTLYVISEATEGTNITDGDVTITNVSEEKTHDGIEVTGTQEKYSPKYHEGTLNGSSVVIYKTVQDALNMAKEGDTIRLLGDITGGGVGTYKGSSDLVHHSNSGGSGFYSKTKDFTLDLGGHTYTINTPAVGSDGYETQGFHMEQDASADNVNITLKNGTIISSGPSVKMLVQNYSNLTLTDITLDGSKIQGSYTLSNNCGNTTINGNTNIIANTGGFAFDVCVYTSYPSVSVTVDTTGTIDGKIEMSKSKNRSFVDSGSLTIKNGTFTKEIVAAPSIANENYASKVAITGGEFASDVSPYVTDKSTCQVLDGKTYVGDSVSKMTATAYSLYIDDAIYYYSEAPIITGEGKIKAKSTDTTGTDVVAQIGENKYYTSFAKALTSAASGDTIKLLNPTENFTAATEIATEVRIDLNGKTFTQDKGITVATGGNLTVIDSGTGGKLAATVTNNGTFTMNSGSIETTGNAITNNAGATLNFNGGNIKSDAIGISNRGTNNIKGGSIIGQIGIKMFAGILGILGGKIRGYAKAANQPSQGDNVPENVISPEDGGETTTDTVGDSEAGTAIAIVPEKTSDSNAKLTVTIGDSTGNTSSDIDIAGTTTAINVGNSTENATDATATNEQSVEVGLYDGKLSSVTTTKGQDGKITESADTNNSGSAITYANPEATLNIDGIILENKFEVTKTGDGESESEINTDKINITSMAMSTSAVNSTTSAAITDKLVTDETGRKTETLGTTEYNFAGNAISKNTVAQVGDSKYRDLQAALTAAASADNKSIELKKNFDISTPLSLSEGLKFTFGDKKLTYSGGGNAALQIESGNVSIDTASNLFDLNGKVLGIAIKDDASVKIKDGETYKDFSPTNKIMTIAGDTMPAYFQNLNDAINQLDGDEMVVANVSAPDEQQPSNVAEPGVVTPADDAETQTSTSGTLTGSNFKLTGLATSQAVSIGSSNISLNAANFGSGGIAVENNNGGYKFQLLSSGSNIADNASIFTGSSVGEEIVNDIAGLTVRGAGGDDTITNRAKASIYGGEGADNITNSGQSAIVYGDAGNDTINNTGVSATVYGGDGADYISNSGKQAYLSGGAGTDTIINNASLGSSDTTFVSLNGGAGNDQLTGSTNSKNFFIYTAGKDTITNYSLTSDQVSLSSDVTPFTDVSKVSYSNGSLVLTYSDSNVLTFASVATASLMHDTNTYAYVYNTANSGVASITKNEQGVTLGAGYTAETFDNSVGYGTVDASAVTSTLTINDYKESTEDKEKNYYAFGTGSDTFNYASGSDSIYNYTYGTDVISLTSGTAAPTDLEDGISYDSTASKFVISLGASNDSLTFDKNKVELKSGDDTYYYEPDRLIKDGNEATLKSTFSSKTFNVQTLGDGFSGVASIDASKVTLSGGVNIIGNTVSSSATNSIKSALYGGTVTGGDNGNTLISSGANASVSVMLRGGAGNDSLVGNTSKELFVYTGGTDSISGYSLAGGDVVRVDNSYRLAEAIYSVGSAGDGGTANISLGWGGTDNLIFEGIGSLEGVLVQQGTANNYYTYAQQYSAHNKSVTLASGYDVKPTGVDVVTFDGTSSLYSDYQTINAAAVNNAISIMGNSLNNYIFGATTAGGSIDGGIGNDKINVSDRGTNANYLFEYTSGKDEVIGFKSSDSVAIDPTKITAAKASNSNTKLALTVDKNKNVLTLRSDDEITKVSLTSGAEYLTKDGYVKGQGLSLFGSARGQIDLNDTQLYSGSNISLVAANSVKSQSVTLTGGTKGGTFIYAENNKRRDGFVYGGGNVSISGYEAGRDRIDLSAASLTSFTVNDTTKEVILKVGEGTISIAGAGGKEILLHDATKGRSYKKMVFKQTGVIENKQKNPTMVTVSGSPTESKYDASSTPTVKKIYVTGLEADGVSIQAGDKNNTQIDASLAGKGVSLSGGAKNDKLIGSDENDLFVYSAGKDIIQGYSSDGDAISISGGLANSLSSAKITAGSKSIKFKFTNKDALTVKANKGETLDGSLTIGDTKYTYVKNAIENGGLVTLTSAFGGTFKTDDSKLDQNVTTVYGGAVSKNLTYKGTNIGETLTGGTKKTTFKGGGGGDSLVGGSGKDVFFYAKGEEGTTKIANFEFGANKDKLKIAGGTISQITSIEGGAIEFAMNNGKNTSNIGWFDITSDKGGNTITPAKVAIKANNTYYWFAQEDIKEEVTVDGGQKTVTLASAGQLITSDSRVSASDVSSYSIIDLNYSTNLAKAGVAVKVTGAKPTPTK